MNRRVHVCSCGQHRALQLFDGVVHTSGVCTVVSTGNEGALVQCIEAWGSLRTVQRHESINEGWVAVEEEEDAAEVHGLRPNQQYLSEHNSQNRQGGNGREEVEMVIPHLQEYIGNRKPVVAGGQ